MKILKHGEAYRDPNKKFITECKICQCQFEYLDMEVRFENVKGETYDFIYCPECHFAIYVKDRWNKND